MFQPLGNWFSQAGKTFSTKLLYKITFSRDGHILSDGQFSQCLALNETPVTYGEAMEV